MFKFPFSFTPKKEEEESQPAKKTYTWNTKEEAKQAFKELLKEKVLKHFYMTQSNKRSYSLMQSVP